MPHGQLGFAIRTVMSSDYRLSAIAANHYVQIASTRFARPAALSLPALLGESAGP